MRGKIKYLFTSYLKSEQGVAALESALMFPILITMLVSMVDIGNAFLTNQKLINCAQTMADLVTRQSNPTLEERADAVKAGQAALSPYSIDTLDYNISSFSFGAGGSPTRVFEDTSGISIDSGITNNMSDLGNQGEGVVVVRVTYRYRPFFTGFVIGAIDMEELAFLRGRKSAVVGAPL